MPVDRPARDLRPLFDPRSVAIVGASANPAKWGHWLANSALRGRHRREIFLVNRSGETLLGERAYRSVLDIPQRIELAVIAVGAAGFEAAALDALRAGAKAIVAITAGLGESGEAGRATERRVVEQVHAAGAVLVGPNCLGLVDTGSELDLASQDFPPGSIGLISQSGNLTLELALLGGEAGVGFSRMISVGNQADLDVAEVVDAFREHSATRVIAVYVEDFRDGRALARAAQAARAAGKQVLLLTVGQSRAGAQAARSHTGALVSESLAVDAACRASGMLRVRTPKEIIDLAQVLLMVDQPRGRRVGVVGDGGGHVALAADRLTAHGLEVPSASDLLAGRIAAVLPATATARNPVDMAGGGEQDFRNYERVVRMLAESAEVDAVLLTGYFGGYSEQSEEFRRLEVEVAQAMAAAARASRRPLLVQTMYPRSPAISALRQEATAIYADIEAAVRALGAAVHGGKPPAGVPELPPAETAAALRESYFNAREAVAEAGVPVVEARAVASVEEALVAARTLGFPVALKALAARHKSDAGGVRLGILDERQLASTFQELAERLRPESFSLERMASLQDGVELLVGVRRDPRFGPVALVGFGGLHAELFQDVAAALAPVSRELALDLIRSLRGAQLLWGARRRPTLDTDAAAAALASLSEYAARRPYIAEIEVNPLLVLTDRVVALDARLVIDHET